MLPSNTTIQHFDTPYRQGYFFPNDKEIDQFIRKLSFEPMVMSSEKYVFGRAASLPNTAFFARDGNVTTNSTNVNLSSVGEFVRIGAEVEMDLLNQIGSRGTNQIEQQVYAVKLRILRELSHRLVHIASLPSIVEIPKQINSYGNGVVLTSSNPFTLQDLYKAISLSKPTDNGVGAGPDCLISSNATLRQVLYVLDQSGEEVEWREDNDLKATVPIIAGLPYYISSSVPNQNIYVLKLKGASAIRLLYAKDPNHDCDAFGIHVYDEPLKKEKNNLTKTVMGYYQVFVPESTILVRLNGVLTPNIT